MHRIAPTSIFLQTTHSIKQTGNLFIGLLYDQPVDDNHCKLKIEHMPYYLLQSKTYVTKGAINKSPIT